MASTALAAPCSARIRWPTTHAREIRRGSEGRHEGLDGELAQAGANGQGLDPLGPEELVAKERLDDRLWTGLGPPAHAGRWLMGLEPVQGRGEDCGWGFVRNPLQIWWGRLVVEALGVFEEEADGGDGPLVRLVFHVCHMGEGGVKINLCANKPDIH